MVTQRDKDSCGSDHLPCRERDRGDVPEPSRLAESTSELDSRPNQTGSLPLKACSPGRGRVTWSHLDQKPRGLQKMEKGHRGELNICLYLLKRFKANLDYLFLSNECKESCNWVPPWPTTYSLDSFPPCPLEAVSPLCTQCNPSVFSLKSILGALGSSNRKRSLLKTEMCRYHLPVIQCRLVTFGQMCHPKHKQPVKANR